MADEQATEDRREDDRADKESWSWWDLPDLVEMTVGVARGIWSLGALIVGLFRD
ncbi:hypothetical protein SAMN02799631_03329 [Methylobacterium sp. 174MFSha1.1]|uniref:hypothetical protein n=1 Tax=Methylobacterium sp. 174MFSha1.1 TaxID=1502749 RepID=UPI0008E52C7F|nr:hypothetical protein [Methylobacterium sp. 174MFSha1.1]SFU94584.1 hypothetical protein SAMN02799631_03329 [Methylobacterium sp. 174MFSha1.1]